MRNLALAAPSYIEAVATKLLGDPSDRSRSELRYGARGSLCIDLDKGVWADHEAGTGGGILDLIARETGRKGREAIAWAKDNVGLVLEDDRPSLPPVKKRQVAAYDYADEDGEILFQVVRFEPKDFRQRRPDPSSPDGWNWSVKGVRQVPYRLHDLQQIEEWGTVYIVEGEKDADRLAKMGCVATCNAGGAGKWPESLNDHFAGLDVVILPDNDEAGRNHANIVASELSYLARSVRVVTLPDLSNKGDVSEWLDRGGTKDALEGLVRTTPFWRPAPPESAFGAIEWADLDRVGIRQDWLVEDLLFEGASCLIFGASGSGKSFMAVDLGLSIARGVPFLGKPTCQGAVLYQAGEGGKGLVKRLRAYRQEHRVVGDVPFILLPARVNLFSEDGDGEAFLNEIRQWQTVHPDLKAVFIDTLSTASPGANENSSEDMSRLLAFGEKVERLGVSLFWVHHKNAAGDRERGHTSLRANVDAAIEVNRDEDDNRTLKLVKQKDGEDGLKLGFDLQSVTIGTYDSGKPMTSCVVRPAEVGSSQTGKAMQRLAAGQHLFMTCLDDVIAQKGGIVPPNCKAPPNSIGAHWQDFKDLYAVLRGNSLDENALRQALKREGDALAARELIGRARTSTEAWVWLTTDGGEYLTRFRK